ncbi:MAG: BMP family ABC transporter substrate-binding protein [Clostridium sp.]|uniref:BMP family ABC transporter substrate-binding protein n=1 Tax=Clostridium sp. TaxID=1506 RepID=UPI0039EC8BEC
MELNAQEEYREAVKRGKKELQSPMPCLDEILKSEEIVANVNLGILEIPLKKIVGTYSRSRSTAFSKGFMPIIENESEFRNKWIALYESHLEEGINQPIKVYEYLNYFYVIEGNKRVSVLKFLKAFSIRAEVIRLVPKKNKDDLTNTIYYEFLDFYNKTRINSIWFTKKHSFNKLSNMLDAYNPKLYLEEDKYEHFKKFKYDTFRDIYLKMGGDKLPITTGDAFLEYISLYGINDSLSDGKVSNRLKQLMKELTHFKDKSIEIQTNSQKDSAKRLSGISSFISLPKKLKVAFVYARSIKTSGWTYGHELGRKYVENILSDQITTKYIQEVPENAFDYEYIKSLAEEGNNVIFTTSPIFRNATLKCAMEYPDIKFFNCSDDTPYKHMSCYFGRVYEARFLTGMIAGAMTKTNIIGYSATSPTSEVISAINSFALGAKLVNPYAEVKVAWTREWNSHDKFTNVETTLLNKNCDVISNRNLKVARAETERFGVYSMLCSFDKGSKEPDKYLAAPIWNWGVYYEKILNNILNDSFKTIVDMFNANSKLINFWYGMSEGVVDIYYSKKYVPISVQKLIEAMKKMIVSNEFNPFTGPICDNSGKLRIDEDQQATPYEILNMNWFVDNVEAEEYVDK